jgi:hypothetical protein
VTASGTAASSDTVVGVIAISADDQWAHAYRNEDSAVAESALGRPDQDPRAIDFFDGAGRRLTPEFDAGGKLTGLRGSDSAAEPDTVRDRLSAVVANAGASLDDHPGDVDAALQDERLTADEARKQLPDLSGYTLDEALRQDKARELFGPHPMNPALQNRGSFLHNLFVHHGRP